MKSSENPEADGGRLGEHTFSPASYRSLAAVVRGTPELHPPLQYRIEHSTLRRPRPPHPPHQHTSGRHTRHPATPPPRHNPAGVVMLPRHSLSGVARESRPGAAPTVKIEFISAASLILGGVIHCSDKVSRNMNFQRWIARPADCRTRRCQN